MTIIIITIIIICRMLERLYLHHLLLLLEKCGNNPQFAYSYATNVDGTTLSAPLVCLFGDLNQACACSTEAIKLCIYLNVLCPLRRFYLFFSRPEYA